MNGNTQKNGNDFVWMHCCSKHSCHWVTLKRNKRCIREYFALSKVNAGLWNNAEIYRKYIVHAYQVMCADDDDDAMEWDGMRQHTKHKCSTFFLFVFSIKRRPQKKITTTTTKINTHRIDRSDAVRKICTQHNVANRWNKMEGGYL